VASMSSGGDLGRMAGVPAVAYKLPLLLDPKTSCQLTRENALYPGRRPTSVLSGTVGAASHQKSATLGEPFHGQERPNVGSDEATTQFGRIICTQMTFATLSIGCEHAD